MFTLSEIDSVVEKSILSIDIGGEPKDLYDPIRYLISIGGKRLRPRLCLTVFSLFSDNIDRSIINPALGIEVFHGFTLIHDDIMDKSDLRRGQLTVHKKWNNNVAILSGDVMSIKSYQFVSDAPQAYLREVLTLFTKTAVEVCEGQQLDMEYESEPFITMEEYISMISLKTAVLFACSAKMGAVLAGVDKKIANLLYNYGHNLGIAFQITDDYLDVYGNSAFFGKKIGEDIINNKKSWLLVEATKRAGNSRKKDLEEILAISSDNSEIKISKMKELYESLDVRKAAEDEIDRYHQRALDSISSIGLNNKQSSQLIDFAEIVIKRNK